MAESDYAEDDGATRSGSDGTQLQPPTPTPPPTPPFHDDVSATLAALTTMGRGFGDAKLNTMVPSLFYQAEERTKQTQLALNRAIERKETAQSESNALRVQVAVLKGEVDSLTETNKRILAEKGSDAKITKFSLTLASVLAPFGVGLLDAKFGLGVGLLALTGACVVIGLFPGLLSILEKGSK